MSQSPVMVFGPSGVSTDSVTLFSDRVTSVVRWSK